MHKERDRLSRQYITAPLNILSVLKTRLLLFVVVVSTLLVLTNASAQEGPLSVAPMQVVSLARFEDNSNNQFLIGIERDVPVSGLLPQVTPDSYFLVARLLAGARVNGSDADFRYRITGLDFEIQKSPWVGAFTLIDYDRSGLSDLNADWIGLKAGPGFDVSSEDTYFSVRALARASLNSVRFDESLFPELGTEASDTKTGLAYGGSGNVSFSASRVFTASGRIDVGAFSAGNELERLSVHVRAEWRTTPRWTIQVTYEYVEATLNNITASRSAPGIGLRYSVAPPRY